MRLKRLEILGFKSFAEKTKLEFHSGITAVVGPNGCGKSNIADAFRWVLGEQSAKSLRGNKMLDVIFAGTSHRKPLNFAEVTLILSEIEGVLPLDYEEVSITRRVHRSGESEYFINRHPVRLKDVQGLFLDTGMGKDAYSIFEQGKIDQVINLSPLERRYIFEEAAGILRFLQRKKEALRKLEQTELNVSRVKDIHQEVERQIIILEQQAEKARQYQENKRLLENLEKAFLWNKWEVLTKRLLEAKNRLQAQNEHITSTSLQLKNLEIELIDAKQTVVEAEGVLKIRGEDVFKARNVKEIQLREKQTSEERLKEIAVKERRWQAELEIMEEKRRHRQSERQLIQKVLSGLEVQRNEFIQSISKKQNEVKVHEDNLVKKRASEQEKQKELLELLQVENRCESEIRQMSIRLENAQEKQKNIQDRKESLSQQHLNLSDRIDEMKQTHAESVEILEGQKERFDQTEKDLKEIAQEMNKAQDQIDKLQKDTIDMKARQKALQRFRDDMEGFSTGSKLLFKEASNAKSPLYKKIKGLFEYFQPEKGMEKALALALKPYSQTLVIDSESDFKLVIEYIKQHKIKDISLFCLEAISEDASTHSVDTKLKGLSPLSQKVMENAFSKHFLRDIYLANHEISTLDALKDNLGKEILTIDEGMVDRRSVVFYSIQGDNNVFLRDAELKSLDKKLQEAEIEKQQLEIVLRAIQQKRNQVQLERGELDKTIRRNEMKIMEIHFVLQKTLTDFEKVRVDLKLLATDGVTHEKIVDELSTLLEEQKLDYNKAKNATGSFQNATHAMIKELEILNTQVKNESLSLREQESEFQRINDEHRKQMHALNLLEVKDIESSHQQSRLEEEIEIGRDVQSQIEIKNSETDRKLKEIEQALTETLAACSDHEQTVFILKNRLQQIEIKITEKQQQLKKREHEQHQIEIQIAQFESNSQALENELNERYHLQIDQLRCECENLEMNVEQIEKQMRALRNTIENAGNINMTSIDECEKYKTRYGFLNEQLDDLSASKHELITIITQLDLESRKIFKSTFDQISLNFKKNFKILFTGGEAELQFTETADILEAGIEIIAQPPGKQMRSINLLSGGEKCLTALALLFAIFEVKPAPFCILDEIDAPLDDTNVERFINILKQFVDLCQFIIITHNKRTMSIADTIVGVSMEERGVSKLLSMDFSKEAATEYVYTNH